MHPIPYAKFDACGNDFLIIDEAEVPGWERALTPGVVREMCHRARGVGADGVLVVDSRRGPVVPVRLFNADGGDGGVSGNGARCAASCLTGRGVPVTALAFPGRLVGVRREEDGYGVEMGAAELGVAPAGGEAGRAAELDAIVRGATGCLSWACAWVGNPHLVAWVTQEGDGILERLAEAVAEARIFANGVNVHVARRVDGRRFALSSWERGCGPTAACGSGACGAVAAGLESGMLRGPRVRVEMAGGAVDVEVRAGGALTLRGPVRELGRGAWSGSAGARGVQ